MKKKIKTAIATITKKAKDTIARTREWLTRASRVLRRFFRDHGQQIANDPSYAAAFITVVAALVDLIAGSDKVRYMAQRLADAYIALHRLLRPRGRGGYGDLGDDWA